MGPTIQSLLLHYGIPLVALLIFIGEVGLPTFIPVEVALLLVGSQAVGSFSALLVGLVLVTVADVLGTTTLHLVARTGGVRLLSRFLPDHEGRSNSSVDRLRRRLAGRDALAVFVLRLIPLVRMWTAVGTGLLRIRVRDFLLGAVPAAMLWAGTPLALGYYFRDNVRGFEARYAAVSHVLLFVVPAAGPVALFAIYVRRGDSPHSRIRRTRFALGLMVALGSAAYLTEAARRTTWAVDRGLLTLPLPLLVGLLVDLGGLAVALLGIAYADLRAERTARQWHIPSELAVEELIITGGWLVLLGVVGMIVVVIELCAPVL